MSTLQEQLRTFAERDRNPMRSGLMLDAATEIDLLAGRVKAAQALIKAGKWAAACAIIEEKK